MAYQNTVTVLLISLVSAAALAEPLAVPQCVTAEDLRAERASLQPYEQKLETHVRRVLRAAYGQVPPNLEAARAVVPADSQGRVHVLIETSDVASLASELRRADVKLLFADSSYGGVEAWVPIPLVASLADFPGVRFISPATKPETDVVVSKADTILHADTARTDAKVDGTGVNVGVISDGATSVGTSQAAGELSMTDTHVVRPHSGDEGTAMMEIVHDLAPGSPLYFASGWTVDNQTSSAGAIIGAFRSLEASGCTVITDDLSYYDVPMFEDGPIAKETDFLVSQGITLTTSAGNIGDSHYLGPYTDGGDYAGTSVTVHHADSFENGLNYYQFNVHAGTTSSPTTAFYKLLWDDPWNTPTDDYNLYVFDNTGNLIDSSVNVQAPGTSHPIEFVGVQNKGGAFAAELVVELASGTPGRFHLYGSGATESTTQVAPGRCIIGHKAAVGEMATAAIEAEDPTSTWNTVEYFSNQGPSEIKYPAPVVRPKPDITGIDGVHTSVAGFTTFHGTSAAAPTIAGVIALLKQASPELTPAQVRTALATTAVDVAAAGFDPFAGPGRADADAAIQWIRPDVTASPSSITMTGYEGRFGATATHVVLTNNVKERGGQMAWSAVPDAPWIKLNRTSGRANGTDEFSVWADTTGIAAPGTSGHIVITFQRCVQPTISIPVSLSLSPAGPTYTVNATVESSSNPGSTNTLPEAITFANANPGATIKFAVPAGDANFTGGVVRFPHASLPAIQQPGILIDGFSQTVAGGDTNTSGPEIQISDTLYFNRSFNCVRGVAMNSIPPASGQNNVQPAIWFDTANSKGNTVIGCYIGCDPTGQNALPTQAGVELSNGAGASRVGGTKAAERNVISGCSSIGIEVFNGGQDNVIVGNWVGIDANGAHGVGAGVTGIQLQYNVFHTAIGGSVLPAANVVSGLQYGIVLFGYPGAAGAPVSGNRVIGNRVGTDPAGMTAIANSTWGVSAIYNGTGNWIGGASAGERNVICGNGDAGVVIESAQITGNRVVGNAIGVGADGSTVIPNKTGVAIADSASQNVIGGTTVLPGTANIIAGNTAAGVFITGGASQNYVEGNAIGNTALLGGVPKPNSGPGVYISGASLSNKIGGMDPADGSAADAGNHIAGNLSGGIILTPDSSRTNAISRNSIHDNIGLGIDVADDGVPQQDGDPYYNPPDLTGAYLYDGFTLVTGGIFNGADGATIQFFTSDQADASGYGEGKKYQLSVPASGTGNFAFAIPALPIGTSISAIAIHTGGSNPGDSSEFSNAVAVQPVPAGSLTPPNVKVLTPNGGNVVQADSIQPITWTTDSAGEVNRHFVDYSLDSGATWTNIPNFIPDDARSWAWLVPNVASTHARIRVRAEDWYGTEGSDTSDADFTIQGSGFANPADALRIAAGLASSDAAAMARLNVVTTGSSATRIDILDAIRLARIAAGTDH